MGRVEFVAEWILCLAMLIGGLWCLAVAVIRFTRLQGGNKNGKS